MKIWYYALTTLSTIGYGDFSPQSVPERLIGSVVLMVGVGVNSFIMGQLIETLMSYKTLNETGAPKDLSKWIALLSRFNNGNPLNKQLITKIEDFFDYKWGNDRLGAVRDERDVRFLDELPDGVQEQIFIEYLFRDFLKRYELYFNPKQIGSLMGEFANPDLREFLVGFVQHLEPRIYDVNSDLIQEQHEEIFEVLFLMSGAVGVGYRLFSEIFYGTQLFMKNKRVFSVINDYQCLENKCSEFLYKAIDNVEALAIRKPNYNDVMESSSELKRMKPAILRNYKKAV